jgi:hypothetical protein
VVSLGLLCSSVGDTMSEIQRVNAQHTYIFLLLQTKFQYISLLEIQTW